MRFELLSEIASRPNLRLTTTQKAALLRIFIAQTPQLALEATTGTRSIVAARDFLYTNNFIVGVDGGVKITGVGYDELVENGLIDENDEITEIGKQLLDAVSTEQRELIENSLPYKTYRKFI